MTLLSELFGAMKKLPLWVFLWVMCVLSPVVVAPFILVFIDPHPVVICGLIGTVVGVGPNLVILYKQRGISKLLSVPHLAWIPCVVYQIHWLTDGTYGGPLTDADGVIYYYTLAAVAVLSISLVLDGMDATKWYRGEREILRAG